MTNLELLHTALDILYTSEPELMAERAHEQAISARLMYHLQHLYPNWDVDVEYNRQGENRDTKQDAEGHNRKPDIIIHKRGPTGPNLVIMLVKCEWNPEDRGKDWSVLQSLKQKHKYRDAFLVEIKKDDAEVISI
jgi:hypothetical protein